MAKDNSVKTRLIDCDAGRRLGCQSFCCRMLVRLKPHEMEPTGDGSPAKGFVDKDEQGYCIHFDKQTSLCQNWDNRPEVCREYECNSDFLLQVALREDFKNIAELAQKAARAYIPEGTYKYVPEIEVDGE
jgi:Fe-S-cluster containining protein